RRHTRSKRDWSSDVCSSDLTLVPVVLLSSPLVSMRRGALPVLLGVAIAVPVLATLAAPAIAYIIHRNGVPHHAVHYRLVAEAVRSEERRVGKGCRWRGAAEA